MMVQPGTPDVDEVGKVKVMHNEGSWYLYTAEKTGEYQRQEEWIETDFILFTEDMR